MSAKFGGAVAKKFRRDRCGADGSNEICIVIPEGWSRAGKVCRGKICDFPSCFLRSCPLFNAQNAGQLTENSADNRQIEIDARAPSKQGYTSAKFYETGALARQAIEPREPQQQANVKFSGRIVPWDLELILRGEIHQGSLRIMRGEP